MKRPDSYANDISLSPGKRVKKLSYISGGFMGRRL